MKAPDRFMVIDDDRTTTILCEHVLFRYSGATPIKIFLDPEEALESISEEYGNSTVPISTVMFLDINMPSMTGWEFLELFNKLPLKVQCQFTIYILSSSIDQRDEERCKSNPLVSGLICKPLKLESIKQIFAIVNNNLIVSFNKIKPH